MRKEDVTADGDVTHIKRFLRWADEQEYDPLELDKDGYEEYLFWMNAEDYAFSTVRGNYYSVNSMYEFLIEEDVVESNPLSEIELTSRNYSFATTRSKKAQKANSNGEIIYLEPDEVSKMYDHAKEAHGSALRNELIIKLLFQTGLRRSEFCSIKLDAVDLQSRRITVENAKVGGSRTVMYRPNTDLLLREWIDVRRPSLPTAEDSPYLFPSDRSERIDERYVNRIVKQTAEAAGLQATHYREHGGNKRAKVTAHVLRHSFAVDMLFNYEMDLRSLQELMGHSELKTTAVYLNIKNDVALNAYQRATSSGRHSSPDEQSVRKRQQPMGVESSRHQQSNW
ncbi:tyrosine-type recombinase/integrase [Halococcus sp. IIIV-5B]|uniref:tyrosine-type recombinase/integrase n=1 Tax=Halococcus sp. IIIV-5B TaxID=2321230 RepID=UPI001314C3DB|nr:tyrosine-type recombinase/integrase [Halococcus sp. IIIV-5B]